MLCNHQLILSADTLISPHQGQGTEAKEEHNVTRHPFLGLELYLHLCLLPLSFWPTKLRDWFYGSVTPGLAVVQRCGKSESPWLVLDIEGNSFKAQQSPVTVSIPDLRSRVSEAETQASRLPQPPGPEATCLGEGQKSSSSIQ